MSLLPEYEQVLNSLSLPSSITTILDGKYHTEEAVYIFVINVTGSDRRGHFGGFFN